MGKNRKEVRMKTIIPLGFAECEPNVPVFFLAGPVKGATDWHTVFCEEIKKQMGEKEFYIAIPKSYRKSPTDCLVKRHQVRPTVFWDSQNAWERHYMEVASKNGCLIFWLPVEDVECPRDDGSPYAITTRGEIGRWEANYMHDRSVKIVVGAETRFKGLRTIHENFLAFDYNFPIYETINQTVIAAIRQLQK